MASSTKARTCKKKHTTLRRLILKWPRGWGLVLDTSFDISELICKALLKIMQTRMRNLQQVWEWDWPTISGIWTDRCSRRRIVSRRLILKWPRGWGLVLDIVSPILPRTNKRNYSASPTAICNLPKGLDLAWDTSFHFYLR